MATVKKKTDKPGYRNRVKELRQVPADDLHPHPNNWRVHSSFQRNSLTSMLNEVGVANAVIAYEDEEWGLTVIDGHQRTEIIDTGDVPTLILDVDRHEAQALLATLDPIAQMAGTDPGVLEDLLATVEGEDNEIAELLEEVRDRYGLGEVMLPEQDTDAAYIGTEGQPVLETATDAPPTNLKTIILYVSLNDIDNVNKWLVGLQSAWDKQDSTEVMLEALEKAYNDEVVNAAGG